MKKFYFVRTLFLAILFATASVSHAVTLIDLTGMVGGGFVSASTPFTVSTAGDYTATLDFFDNPTPRGSFFGLFDIASGLTLLEYSFISGESFASFTTALNTGTYTVGFGGFNTVASTNYHMIVTSPVPEAETYALMLAGLGLIGLISRRRKTSSAALNFA